MNLTRVTRGQIIDYYTQDGGKNQQNIEKLIVRRTKEGNHVGIIFKDKRGLNFYINYRQFFKFAYTDPEEFRDKCANYQHTMTAAQRFETNKLTTEKLINNYNIPSNKVEYEIVKSGKIKFRNAVIVTLVLAAIAGGTYALTRNNPGKGQEIQTPPAVSQLAGNEKPPVLTNAPDAVPTVSPEETPAYILYNKLLDKYDDVYNGSVNWDEVLKYAKKIQADLKRGGHTVTEEEAIRFYMGLNIEGGFADKDQVDSFLATAQKYDDVNNKPAIDTYQNNDKSKNYVAISFTKYIENPTDRAWAETVWNADQAVYEKALATKDIKNLPKAEMAYAFGIEAMGPAENEQGFVMVKDPNNSNKTISIINTDVSWSVRMAAGVIPSEGLNGFVAATTEKYSVPANSIANNNDFYMGNVGVDFIAKKIATTRYVLDAQLRNNPIGPQNVDCDSMDDLTETTGGKQKN